MYLPKQSPPFFSAYSLLPFSVKDWLWVWIIWYLAANCDS